MLPSLYKKNMMYPTLKLPEKSFTQPISLQSLRHKYWAVPKMLWKFTQNVSVSNGLSYNKQNASLWVKF